MKSDQLAELVQELIDSNSEMTAEIVQVIALMECAKHLAVIAEHCSKGRGWQPRKQRGETAAESSTPKQGIHMAPKKQT